ncbi:MULTISPECIES: pilus assembly protein TadG-related protein [unclassified Sphingomonas]|uniref:pilus assembly protein TadG-related protein n=1 Tax=unclassified Sphingomonas TaxID=196159 RepID=UPI00160827D9|nr:MULTISPECIES: pilus assembly protein TadG-related protein [unclassified Sphingomonas]MBB3346603.1 Flp pilus assembly protein TadG [Sphingomonas sp. BK069]MBB3473081.1 Flp pilus assembly protein TadG [Sphingomonas sp. BK345]
MRSRSRLFPSLRYRLTPLLHDRRGSTIGIMAAGLVVGIGSLGSAIDVGRMYIVKSQLQAGVDAAALAGARAFGVTDNSPNSRSKQVDSYFDGNFSRSPAYMGTTNVIVTPTFAVVNGVNVTTVNAAATLDMSFMRLFGFRDVTMRAVAKAELQPRTLEVMVVLDNTGSMADPLSNGKTRIQALKDASNSFVDILFQGGTQRKDLALGFIPYDITVNVGRLLEKARPNSVTPVVGFNAGFVNDWGAWPSNPYAWKGCVMNDATVRDLSADRFVSEPNAWDVTRTLPGEGSNPTVAPYFIPPIYVPTFKKPATGGVPTNKLIDQDSDYYQAAGNSNLYRLDASPEGAAGAQKLVNSAAYRSWLYDYYMGLNEDGSANTQNDVIRRLDDSYYASGDGTRIGANWKVDWTRLPKYSSWAAKPSTSVVMTSGNTPGNSPNWQCPEEAMLPLYNRTKAEYTSYIRDKNAAIKPANGTIHHTGLLWGYRLLVRDDVFTRPRPTGLPAEKPRRAIVFMTDGLNEVTEAQNNYIDRTFTWYGRWSDLAISSTSDSAEEQMLRRFAKTCANIQREDNAPDVYIITLVKNSTAVDNVFNACAPGRVYRTSDATQLNAAFQNVAAELVDLHLTQ